MGRREVLIKGSILGAGVVVGAAGGFAAGSARDIQQRVEDVDVAIIGAGVAGTYSAWRLSTADGGQRRAPVVFEASQRIGGRLWSEPVAPVTNQVAELGGMRIPPQHVMMTDLISALNLPTIPFYASSPDALVRLRGVRLRRSEVKRAGQFPYDLPPRLAAMSPADFEALVLTNLGVTADIDPAGVEVGPWLAPLSYRGQPLWQIKAVDMLDEMLGYNGSQFLQAWSAYEVSTIAASTWVGNQLAVTGTDFVAIKDGFQRVPLTMAAQAQEAGEPVRLGHTLEALAAEPDGRVRLQFRQANGEPYLARASAVILAMPTPALRALVQTSPLLADSRALSIGLGHVLEREQVKAYLSYESAWWQELGLKPGRSVSDGPLKQTFYLQPQPDGPAMLLACYPNGDLPADYWANVVPDTGLDGPTEITPEFALEITAKLSELHGINVPMPVNGRVHWWGPVGHGGVSLWGAGVKPWEVAPTVRTPVPGVRLSICGDAMSLNQGWAVGAAQTAELVLQEQFGLGRPSWLSPAAALGL